MSKSEEIEESCPMYVMINILSGKWKLAILCHLSKNVVRFSELQKSLPHITQRILTMQLRELERDSIIYRKVYPEVPPKVEYGLTEIGESLKPILKLVCTWGKDYRNKMNEKA
jgi:DNA-binding HxlR family transcriptional regulator